MAYADFVTAMMALFMVLWISAQDQKILLATSRYFQSPFTSPFEDHSGIMPFNKESNSGSAQSTDEMAGKEKPSVSDRQIELNFLNSVAADFQRLLRLEENLEQKPIEIEVTSDGLRVTLFDRPGKALFVQDSTEFTEWGRFVLQGLSWMVERNQFRVTIDGHTRAGIAPRENYSSWELSSDRANAARRTLVHYAVAPAQIERVTGYADSRPMDGEKPESDSNQRIAISLSLTGKPRDPQRRAGGASGSAP